jgi:DNA-binding transcriptional regulator YhcF (GntR family)
MTGRGCFVKPHPAEKLNTKRTALASEKLVKDIEYYKSLGLSMSDVIELLKELWDTGKHI